MYVSLQDDDQILVFVMDAGTGKLTPKAEVPVSGGPAALTISPDRNALYVGQRGTPGISSFRISLESVAARCTSRKAGRQAPYPAVQVASPKVLGRKFPGAVG